VARLLKISNSNKRSLSDLESYNGNRCFELGPFWRTRILLYRLGSECKERVLLAYVLSVNNTRSHTEVCYHLLKGFWNPSKVLRLIFKLFIIAESETINFSLLFERFYCSSQTKDLYSKRRIVLHHLGSYSELNFC
jgi:hypothetical protein